MDGTTLTLKDLNVVGGTNPSTGKPIALTALNHSLKFFASDGNMQKIINDTTLQDFNETAWSTFKTETAELMFVYVDAQHHWYLAQDTGFQYVMDGYPLEAGRGYLLFAANALGFGADVTDSGTVRDFSVEASVGRNKSALLGNIAPKDMKLKEFVIVGGTNPSTGKPIALTALNHSIKFFGSDGNMMKIKDDTALQDFNETAWNTFKTETAELMFVFVDAQHHWYLAQDTGFSYIMDDYVVKAGRGMIPFAANALGFGLNFTMPPAIEKPIAE